MFFFFQSSTKIVKVLLRSKLHVMSEAKTRFLWLTRCGCNYVCHRNKVWVPQTKNIELEKVLFSSPPLKIYVPVSPRYQSNLTCGNLLESYCSVVLTSFSQVNRSKEAFFHRKTRSVMASSHSSDEFVTCSSDSESSSGSSSNDEIEETAEIGQEIHSYDDSVEPVPTTEEVFQYMEQLELEEEQTLLSRFSGEEDVSNWYVNVLFAVFHSGEHYRISVF